MQQRLIVTMTSRINMHTPLLHRYCDHAAGLLNPMSINLRASLVTPTVALLLIGVT